jgi:hypothetical protein
MLGQRRGRLLLELGNEAWRISRSDRGRAARDRARLERGGLALALEIAIHRTPMYAKLLGHALGGRPACHRCHDPLSEIELIGAHATLPSPASLAPSQCFC